MSKRSASWMLVTVVEREQSQILVLMSSAAVKTCVKEDQHRLCVETDQLICCDSSKNGLHMRGG